MPLLIPDGIFSKPLRGVLFNLMCVMLAKPGPICIANTVVYGKASVSMSEWEGNGPISDFYLMQVNMI